MISITLDNERYAACITALAAWWTSDRSIDAKTSPLAWIMSTRVMNVIGIVR